MYDCHKFSDHFEMPFQLNETLKENNAHVLITGIERAFLVPYSMLSMCESIMATLEECKNSDCAPLPLVIIPNPENGTFFQSLPCQSIQCRSVCVEPNTDQLSDEEKSWITGTNGKFKTIEWITDMEKDSTIAWVKMVRPFARQSMRHFDQLQTYRGHAMIDRVLSYVLHVMCHYPRHTNEMMPKVDPKQRPGDTVDGFLGNADEWEDMREWCNMMYNQPLITWNVMMEMTNNLGMVRLSEYLPMMFAYHLCHTTTGRLLQETDLNFVPASKQHVDEEGNIVIYVMDEELAKMIHEKAKPS